MIDNVFLDLIDALKQSLETSMLEQLPNEEHIMLDVFVGDMHFQASYSLPGEINPSNLRVDVDLEWPVWNQSIYKSWALGESEPEPMELGIEISVRAVGLSEPADMSKILPELEKSSPQSVSIPIDLSSTVTSQTTLGDDLGIEYELEINYDGSMILEEFSFMRRIEFEDTFKHVGPWLASILVRLSDLPLKFLPTNFE